MPSNLTDLVSSCPDSWEFFRNFCYLFVRSPELTWAEAQLHCREYLADLISVEEPEEHDFLSRWLRTNDPTLSVRKWFFCNVESLLCL